MPPFGLARVSAGGDGAFTFGEHPQISRIARGRATGTQGGLRMGRRVTSSRFKEARR